MNEKESKIISLVSQLNEIAEGWKNLAFPNPVSEELVKKE